MNNHLNTALVLHFKLFSLEYLQNWPVFDGKKVRKYTFSKSTYCVWTKINWSLQKLTSFKYFDRNKFNKIPICILKVPHYDIQFERSSRNSMNFKRMEVLLKTEHILYSMAVFRRITFRPSSCSKQSSSSMFIWCDALQLEMSFELIFFILMCIYCTDAVYVRSSLPLISLRFEPCNFRYIYRLVLGNW